MLGRNPEGVARTTFPLDAATAGLSGSQPPRRTPEKTVNSPAAITSTPAHRASFFRTIPTTANAGDDPRTNPPISTAPASADPVDTAPSSVLSVTPHGTRIVAAPRANGDPFNGRHAIGLRSSAIPATTTPAPAVTEDHSSDLRRDHQDSADETQQRPQQHMSDRPAEQKRPDAVDPAISPPWTAVHDTEPASSPAPTPPANKAITSAT